MTVDDEGAVLTHREAIPTISSPAVTAAAIAYSLPAIRSSFGRCAARPVRQQFEADCSGDAQLRIRQQYDSPGRQASNDSGKPLLSWRVAILPYLGHQDLYNKFNLDEPWDSAHNKALLKEMPSMYTCPEPSQARVIHHDLPGDRRKERDVRERSGRWVAKT